MRRKNFWPLVLLAAALTPVPAMFADDDNEFTVRITQQAFDPLPPVSFVRVANDSVHLVFIAPSGYRCVSNDERREVRLTARDGSASITLRFHGVQLPESEAIAIWRDLLAERHTGAQVLEEFTQAVAGGARPAFDLLWKRSGSPTLKLRSIFIPVGEQCIEVSLVSTPENFEQDRHALTQILVSLRSAEGKDPAPPELSNKI